MIQFSTSAYPVRIDACLNRSVYGVIAGRQYDPIDASVLSYQSCETLWIVIAVIQRFDNCSYHGQPSNRRRSGLYHAGLRLLGKQLLSKKTYLSSLLKPQFWQWGFDC
jgi:hypothetical protein